MTSPVPPSDDRRSFLSKILAIGFGAAALAVPAFAAVATFLNPWRQKGPTGKWLPVASFDALTAGGPPQSFPVVADRWDAWNHFPSETIGKVFLCRTSDGQIHAFQSICPHNGGLVQFRNDKNCFWCPTHGAKFDREGRRIAGDNVAPRDLDSLDAKVIDGIVWVQFEKFQDGTPEKIVKT